MGRGLSELQKAILKIAWDEKEKHDDASKDEALVARWKKWDHANFNRYKFDSQPVVPIEFAPFIEDNWQGFTWITDVFVKYYHWTPLSAWRGESKFSKAKIGLKPYMAAYLAVRKSLARLESRGLIYLSGDKSSYALTSEGKDLMAKLMQRPGKENPKLVEEKFSGIKENDNNMVRAKLDDLD
jgi:hypothetical protein